MTKKRNIMKEFRLDEISAVDHPAQAPALVSIMKRAKPMEEENPMDEDEEGEECEDKKKTAKAGVPDSADASKSTSGDSTADSVGNVRKEDIMSDTKNEKTVDPAVAKQLETLQKRAERAEQISALSDAQRSIFKGLTVEKQDEFLALKPEAREALVTKAAEQNSVVYTDSRGQEYRKSDDQRLVALAKQADEEREARLAAETVNKNVELRKRAEELQHIPGTVEVRMSILKGIDTLPAEQRSGALEALKAQDVALGAAFKRAGTSLVPNQVNVLETIAKRIKSEQPTLTIEQAMVKALETPEGEAAYAKSIGL